MKSFRKGFTMIELIFVIVVIGILSSIAVPKLSATRDDAKFVASLASIKQTVANIQSSYMADPSSITHRTDWFGGTYNNAKDNGGCVAIFTYITGGEKRMYISKYPSHNTCDFTGADRDRLIAKVEESLGIKFGTTSWGVNTAANYYIARLNKRRLKL